MVGKPLDGRWPKTIEPLPPELEAKRTAWHEYWLQRYLERFSFVPKFNHRFLGRLPRRTSAETVLETGPGWESAVRQLLRSDDVYYACDEDVHICQQLRHDLPASHVLAGDVQQSIPLDDAYVDRVVA